MGHIPATDAKSSLSGYDLAVQAAMHLGSSGTVLLPLIKQRFAEIQEAFPDRKQVLTGTLKAAIDVCEGRRNPPVHASINGRGVINLMVGPSPVALTSGAIPVAPTPVSAASSFLRQSESMPSPTVTPIQSSRGFSIVPVAIVVVVIVGIVLYFFRRKSS